MGAKHKNKIDKLQGEGDRDKYLGNDEGQDGEGRYGMQVAQLTKKKMTKMTFSVSQIF